MGSPASFHAYHSTPAILDSWRRDPTPGLLRCTTAGPRSSCACWRGTSGASPTSPSQPMAIIYTQERGKTGAYIAGTLVTPRACCTPFIGRQAAQTSAFISISSLQGGTWRLVEKMAGCVSLTCARALKLGSSVLLGMWLMAVSFTPCSHCWRRRRDSGDFLRWSMALSQMHQGRGVKKMMTIWKNKRLALQMAMRDPSWAQMRMF